MRTILLVDDDLDVLSSLEAILDQPEYTIIVRSDAEQALSAIREGARVDLVVTDYSMPGMDAQEYLTRLEQALPGAPVIILTGHSIVNTCIQSSSSVPFQFVGKPVEPKELRRIVESTLDSFDSGIRPAS